MGVRNESVRLSLDDAGFSTGMARAAAATALFQRELNELDGTGVRSHKTIPTVSEDVDKVSKSSRSAGPEIDRLSGRLALLAKTAAVLGPGLIPIGAVAVPAVAGLASQLGFAAIGMGSLVAASQGVGDALKAVNDAALEPTAANLEKARLAMERLGPEAQTFVAHFQELRPVLGEIRDAAARGWFPGLTEALDNFAQVAPQVADIFERIGQVGGDLAARGVSWFDSAQGREFLTFVEANAPQALEELGRTAGNVARGLASLWQAFDPLNDDFSTWMLNASRGFAEWADGLAQTEGFQEFVAYVRENGPKVADALVAIGNAVLQIVEAAAPLGGPVLEALTAFANTIATIADSPLGTPIMTAVTAMSALSLATTAANGAILRLNASMATLGLTTKFGGLGGTAGVALLATLEGIRYQTENFKKTQSGEQNGWVGGLKALVPAAGYAEDFAKSLGILEDKSKDADAGLNRLPPSLREIVPAASATDSVLRTLNRTLAHHAEIALAAFDAETRWRQALVGARKQAEASNAGIRGNSEAALKNREALSGLAAAWNNQSEAVRNNLGRQRAARRAFVQTATDMGVPIKRARELARTLLDMPEKVEPKVTVNTRGAQDAITSVDRLLASLNGRTAVTYVETRHRSVGSGFGKAANPTLNADGGTVPKTGMPYADRHLYLLADGEEVISNRYGQADRHRELLKAINAGRLADGGTAGRRLPALPFADLGGINVASANLRELNKALRESKKALDRETKQRDAVLDKMRSLNQSVRDNLRSDLFPDRSVWTAGGGVSGAIGTLRRDIATSAALKADIAALKRKGLRGDALADLLANADAMTIDQFANGPASQIAEYQRLYKVRDSYAANVAAAAASAAFGPDRRRETRHQHAVEHRLHAIEKAIRQEHREDRRSSRKGAAGSSRRKARGSVR